MADRKDPRRYDDMLFLPRHRSPTRLPMPRENRAAQFAPFAALTGHDEAVRETARLTEECPVLDDCSKALLNQQLQLLLAMLHRQPELTVQYFRPDDRKSGGAVVTHTGAVKKLDAYLRTLLFTDGTAVPIEHILGLESDLFPFSP